jgi:hypothetical protein
MVEFGVHRNGSDTKIAASTDNTDSDFATIGDKDF